MPTKWIIPNERLPQIRVGHGNSWKHDMLGRASPESFGFRAKMEKLWKSQCFTEIFFQGQHQCHS